MPREVQDGSPDAELIKLACTIESFLSGCITIRYSSSKTLDRKDMQRVVRSAAYNTAGVSVNLQDIYNQMEQENHWELSLLINGPSSSQL